MTSSPATGTMVGAAGTRLRTLLWTPGGRAIGRVLLVHGLSEHAGRYRHVAEHLVERGLAVMAFDLRGHGASEGRRGQLESFQLLVDDVGLAREVAERRLPGEGAPFVYGHSLGGLAVIRYLQQRRPDLPGAVLSAPWLGTAVAIPGWLRALVNVLLRLAPDLPLSNPRLNPGLLTRDPEMQRAFVEDPLVHHRLSPRFFHEVESAQERALTDGLPGDLPLLVLVPGDDGLADPGTTLEWVGSLDAGRVTLERLEGSRHEPHNDLDAESVLALLGSWILERSDG